MLLKIDQFVHVLFFSKTLNHVVFMLPHASGQITGYSCVQCAIALARHYVNGWLLFRHYDFLDSCFRRNEVGW